MVVVAQPDGIILQGAMPLAIQQAAPNHLITARMRAPREDVVQMELRANQFQMKIVGVQKGVVEMTKDTVVVPKIQLNLDF
jgi:hypothetical protein